MIENTFNSYFTAAFCKSSSLLNLNSLWLQPTKASLCSRDLLQLPSSRLVFMVTVSLCSLEVSLCLPLIVQRLIYKSKSIYKSNLIELLTFCLFFFFYRATTDQISGLISISWSVPLPQLVTASDSCHWPCESMLPPRPRPASLLRCSRIYGSTKVPH